MSCLFPISARAPHCEKGFLSLLQAHLDAAYLT